MLLDFSRASGTPNKVIPKLTKPRPPWFTANWPEGCKHLCLIVSKERYVNPSNYCLSLLSLSPGLPCRVSAASSSSCRLLIFVCVTIVSPDCLVLQWPDSGPRKQFRLYSLHSLGPDDPRADPIIAWLQLASRHSHHTLSQT